MSKPYQVSHSKLSTFRRCLQQYKWKYLDKFYPPSSMGQIRGTCGHTALAEWHQSYDADKATQAAWDLWASYGYSDTEDWLLLEGSLQRYYDYSREHDKFKLTVAEQKFEIVLDVSGTDVLFIGYIDGIILEKKVTWLLENKFYKRMQGDEGLYMDAQVSLYLLAAHLLGYKAQGVIYNKVRVADTKVAVKEPVVRSRVHRNPMGFDRIQEELVNQIQAMMDFETKGGRPYRNPTKDCNWDCSFYPACLSLMDDGQEPTVMLKDIAETYKGDI